MIFHPFIICSIFTLAHSLGIALNADSLSGKSFRPPIPDSVNSGVLDVSVEHKVLFNTGRRIENDKFFFSRPDTSSDFIYLYQSDTKEGEYCDNPGPYSIIEDGENHYYFRGLDKTFTQNQIDQKSTQIERGFGIFRHEFFSKWITLHHAAKRYPEEGKVSDTVIDRNRLQYFVIEEKDFPVRIGNTDSLQAISESLNLKGSSKFLFYLDPQSRIVREEEYFYFNNDTEITKSIFRNFEKADGMRVRGMIYDSLLKYSKSYSRKSIPESGNDRPKSRSIDSLIGDVFPVFDITSVAAQTEKISALPLDYLLLDFSYASCLPCHESTPSLNKLQREYSGKSFSVIGMNPFDKIEQIRSTVAKDSIVYPIYSIKRNDAEELGVTAYPSFFLLDKKRNIRAVFKGYSTDLYKRLSEEVEKLMKE